MTAQTQPAQPDALRLAASIKASGQFTPLAELDDAATVLRRLHAELAQLRESRKPLSERQALLIAAEAYDCRDAIRRTEAFHGIGEKTP